MAREIRTATRIVSPGATAMVAFAKSIPKRPGSGTTINEKVKNPTNRLGALLASMKSDRDMLDELYMVAMALKADADEAKAALAHVAKGTDKRKAWEDVLWAILNTREFLFRH